jgi:dihydroorotate dehydrogenase (NAD+) catalytic subunit
MIAGAAAVQVGTAIFIDPFIWTTLLADLQAYMRRHGIARLQEIVGSLDTSAREKEWISS